MCDVIVAMVRKPDPFDIPIISSLRRYACQKYILLTKNRKGNLDGVTIQEKENML